MAFEIPVPDGRFSALLPEVILASRSPARKSLLEAHGCRVRVCPADSDEQHNGTAGLEVVEQLALRKLETYLARFGRPSIPVLAADTLVGINGYLVGKAASPDDAYRHISLFAGTTHSVFSGFALYLPDEPTAAGDTVSGADEAKVLFRDMDRDEVQQYVASGDWRGAAGSYRIQGLARYFVSGIDGDYNTVVGLPIKKISAILVAPDCRRQSGISTLG